MQTPGIALPALSRIAEYHPQWALAAAAGVPVRPDVRPLSVTFSSTSQIGTPIPASFDQPISRYSIFCGADLTIDPTAAFAGNILKGTNDVTMARVSAQTFTLLTTGPTGNFTPVFEETPLQSIPRLLLPFAGMWAMRGPSENVKATFTLQSTPNGGVPFTSWLSLSFAVLEVGEVCARIMAMSVLAARKQLRDEHGICAP